jgi:DNA-binding IclR family transcriptional regulator
MTGERAGRDPLSIRVLEVIHDMQAHRNGRGVQLDDIVDRVTYGAIARRMAPNRSTVVSCLHTLIEIGYVRVDRWSKYRLTSQGWSDGLGRPSEIFPWSD